MQCSSYFTDNLGEGQNVMTVPILDIHCCQISTEDCEPKDFSMKSIKKLKHVPPPLNLDFQLPRNSLREFANIATWPKSPLMQKNLPFRKRAHSMSHTEDEAQQSPACAAAPVDSCCPPPRDRQSTPQSSVWGSSTVQLSPAPSSLGDSREELAWPSAGWHCFQSGVLVKVDGQAGGTGGAWKASEELGQSWQCPDWLRLLRLENVQEAGGSFVLSFSCLGAAGQVTARCDADHVLYVRDKGWSAVYPQCVFKIHGKMCPSIELGDVCVAAPKTSVLSPDICDRFQRFNFPPEDSQLHLQLPQHPLPLSPPVSPTKKLKDPDRPKRPMNAFMLFAQRFRPKLIQLHPGKDNRAISVLLGAAWRGLSPAQQDVYRSEACGLAEEQKRRHPDCWKRRRSHSTS
ncbi:HMG box-containing protein 1-like [Bacillus rossius redtenbacheri]|uniref:HMG box-containing protein 1-like n=1 Tax=Bacillus rossius redtenbacheri TaxID=93214 RepID=UPI002FDDADB2